MRLGGNQSRVFVITLVTLVPSPKREKYQEEYLEEGLNNWRRTFSTRATGAAPRREPFGVSGVLNGPHSKEYPSSRGYGTVNRAITK